MKVKNIHKELYINTGQEKNEGSPDISFTLKTNCEELNALFLELESVIERINNFKLKVYEYAPTEQVDSPISPPAFSFDEFFKTVDVKRIEAYDGKSFTAEHKERMRQSFIKHNGYPSIIEIWPEIFANKI